GEPVDVEEDAAEGDGDGDVDGAAGERRPGPPPTPAAGDEGEGGPGGGGGGGVAAGDGGAEGRRDCLDFRAGPVDDLLDRLGEELVPEDHRQQEQGHPAV